MKTFVCLILAPLLFCNIILWWQHSRGMAVAYAIALALSPKLIGDAWHLRHA